MKKMNCLLIALSGALAALPASADELDTCKTPNPIYWGCLAAIKCNTAPIGGTYCGITASAFCDRVVDPKKMAEDGAKIAAAAVACSKVPPANMIPYKTEIAVGQASAACQAKIVGVQAPAQKSFCNGLASFQKLCPKPEFFDICPKLPWLPDNRVVNLPDPREIEKKVLRQVYKTVTSAFGDHHSHRPYTGADPTYLRALTANHVNGTMLAAASGDFTSVGMFAQDTKDANPPPNMYLEGLRSAVGEMTPEDLTGLAQAVALEIENGTRPRPGGIPGPGGIHGAHPQQTNWTLDTALELWKEIAEAAWSAIPEPLTLKMSHGHLTPTPMHINRRRNAAIASAIGAKYRTSFPELSVMVFAQSLRGSNAGPIGALIVAEFMHAGYQSRLQNGERLRQGEGLMSENGKYFLYLQDDCNLIWTGPGIYGGLQQWRKDWRGQTCELVQQGDGNLVLYRKDGKPLWWGNTDPGVKFQGHTVHSRNYATVLQDDGNVVTHDGNQNKVWDSGSYLCHQHLRYWNDAKSDRKYCY